MIPALIRAASSTVAAGTSAGKAVGRSAVGKLAKNAREGHLANTVWAVQAVGDVFSRWFPSVTFTSQVAVNGGKSTSNQVVLHSALSIAFGMLQSRSSFVADIVLRVKNDPIKNVVTIQYAVSSASALAMANDLNGLIFSIGNTITSKAKDGLDGLAEELSPAYGIYKKLAGQPAGANQNGLDILAKALGDLSVKLGAGAAFTLHHDRVAGGRPFKPITIRDDENKVFGRMIYQPWLTRDPAANPQPPAVNGVDLRTLVAQVLHDPGVRPPLPTTHIGPPTVDSEIRGH